MSSIYVVWSNSTIIIHTGTLTLKTSLCVCVCVPSCCSSGRHIHTAGADASNSITAKHVALCNSRGDILRSAFLAFSILIYTLN